MYKTIYTEVEVDVDLPMKIGAEWVYYIRATYKEIKGLRV
jgi:hypothetical protein